MDFHIQSAQFEFSVPCQTCRLTLDFSNLSLICDKRVLFSSFIDDAQLKDSADAGNRTGLLFDNPGSLLLPKHHCLLAFWSCPGECVKGEENHPPQWCLSS